VTVEINCPDAETAAAIAEALVARRLAACANIHAPIDSIYHWQGRVERAGEVPLTLKAPAGHFEALAAAVRALHPYEVPSILAWPVSATEDYRAWVVAETAGADLGR
jgi:periplasmic divalent cation tolerance protein